MRDVYTKLVGAIHHGTVLRNGDRFTVYLKIDHRLHALVLMGGHEGENHFDHGAAIPVTPGIACARYGMRTHHENAGSWHEPASRPHPPARKSFAPEYYQ